MGDGEGAPTTPATAVPPPIMRKRGGTGGYEGRTDFPDLFATDGTPLPAVHASPEEKVDYFREKLRRAEAQITRFREAWQVRENDIDAAEAQFGREKARADETASTLQKMQAFLEQKKLEIEAYTKKVSGALAERDASLQAARAEAEEARGRAEQARDDADEAHAEAERMAAELEQARAEAAQARAAAKQARAEADESQAEAQQAQSESNDTRAALERGQAEAAELRQRLEQQLATREDELGRVVALAKEQQAAVQARDAALQERDAALQQRDAEIARLNDDLSRSSGASTAAQGELESRARAAVADRDAAIEKLKGAVGSRNTAIEQLDGAVRERDAALAERDATIGKLTEGLRNAVARCKAVEADLAQAKAAPSPAVDAEGIRKALHVAGVLLGDVEGAYASRLGAEARETLGRVRRALEIAGELTRGGR